MIGMDAEHYRQVLEQYHLDGFARMFGNPSQTMISPTATNLRDGERVAVDGTEVLLRHMNTWDGKRPLYMSLNAWTKHGYDGYHYWPTRVRIGALFFDLDAKDRTELALEDLHRAMEGAERDHLDGAALLSGGKGYHFYLLLRPENRAFDEVLKREVRASTIYFAKRWGLETMDLHCTEPRRLIRLPWGRYVRESDETEEWVAYPRRTLPLTPDEAMNMTTSEIDAIASERKPTVGRYRTGGEMLTLRQIVEGYDISYSLADTDRVREIPVATPTSPSYAPVTDIGEIMKVVEPRMCVQQTIFSNRPPHYMRVAFATRLKMHNDSVPGHPLFDEEWLQAFFEDFEEKYKWTDREKVAKRRYQIHNLYTGPYNDSMTCGRLAKEWEACVGKECQFYEWASKRYGFRVVTADEEENGSNE